MISSSAVKLTVCVTSKSMPDLQSSDKMALFSKLFLKRPDSSSDCQRQSKVQKVPGDCFVYAFLCACHFHRFCIEIRGFVYLCRRDCVLDPAAAVGVCAGRESRGKGCEGEGASGGCG